MKNYDGQFAVINVSSKYNQELDDLTIVAICDTKEAAETECLRRDEGPTFLSHNEYSVRHVVCQIIESNADYQQHFLDQIDDWEGCPSEDGEDYEANCQWAECRVLSSGGNLPVTVVMDENQWYRRDVATLMIVEWIAD